jgi:hypothetical protein
MNFLQGPAAIAEAVHRSFTPDFRCPSQNPHQATALETGI